MFSRVRSVLARSVLLTKVTLRIVFKQDPELLLFPLLSLVVLGGAAIGIFALASANASANGLSPGQPLIAAVACTVLAAPVVAVYVAFCTTHTVRVRLEGGNASLWQSLGYGFRNFPRALAWAFAALGASLVLGGLRGGLKNLGFLGAVLSRPLMWILETAWSISKLLVIPAMVYEGVGPLQGLKSSTAAIRRTWGEALVRHLGFGAIFSAVQFVLVLFLVLFALAAPVGSRLQLVGVGVVFACMLVVHVVSGLVNTVFNAAMYHFATRGSAGLGFGPEILRDALHSRASAP